MIWVGTSGFQYPEWKGKFYPEKISPKKMLSFYAERFNTTEVNYTFRRMPSESTLANWAEATRVEFRFTLKAPQQITHFSKLRGCESIVQRFIAAARTLGPKLGAILFQLPPSLPRDVKLLSVFLDTLPAKTQAAFEFRHESWFADETFAALRSHNAALCISDSETLHAPTVNTADFAYFRLRDEGYGKADIKRWAAEVQKTSALKETYVYFKHEETSTAPEFARQLLAAMT